jgi:hypothetical protein
MKWVMPSFLTTIISIIAIGLNNRFGWHLSPDQLIASIGLAINFVGITLLADIAKIRRGEMPNFNSTKLFTLLFALLMIGFGDYVGIRLDDESVWFIAGTAAAFITGKGIKDIMQRKETETDEPTIQSGSNK